jgi:fructose-specific phosphotransferase system IIC component
MELSLAGLSNSIESFNILVAIGVLFAYLVVDAMYAYYTLAITDHNAFAAANTGTLLHFLLAVGVISYVQNYLYIIPIAVGSWIGTFLVVRRKSMSTSSNLNTPT